MKTINAFLAALAVSVALAPAVQAKGGGKGAPKAAAVKVPKNPAALPKK